MQFSKKSIFLMVNIIEVICSIPRNVFNINATDNLYFDYYNRSLDTAKLKIQNSKNIVKSVEIIAKHPKPTLTILSECTKKIKKTIKLSISNIIFDADDSKKLSNYLAKLKISSFYMGMLIFKPKEKKITSLFKSFKKSKYLTEIESYNMALTLEDAQYISKILKHKNTSLEKIDIKYDTDYINNIPFINIILFKGKFKIEYIRYGEINEEMLNEIKAGLAINNTLKKLKLSVKNDIENLGKHASDIYKISNSLEELDLYYYFSKKNICSKHNLNKITRMEYHFTINFVDNKDLVISYDLLNLSDLIPIFFKIDADNNSPIKNIKLFIKKVNLNFKNKNEKNNLDNLYNKIKDKKINIKFFIKDKCYDLMDYERELNLISN